MLKDFAPMIIAVASVCMATLVGSVVYSLLNKRFKRSVEFLKFVPLIAMTVALGLLFYYILSLVLFGVEVTNGLYCWKQNC